MTEIALAWQNPIVGMVWRGRLKGSFLCSISLLEQGEGAFIKAGAFIRTFTVYNLLRVIYRASVASLTSWKQECHVPRNHDHGMEDTCHTHEV